MTSLARGPKRSFWSPATTPDMNRRGGDVAKNLFALYTYVTERLVDAGTSRTTPSAVDDAIKVSAGRSRTSWAELERRDRENRPQEAALVG